MEKIYIVPNLSKPNMKDVLETIGTFATTYGVSLVFPLERKDELKRIYPEMDVVFFDDTEPLPDMAIAIGGDGTLLETAKQMAPYNVPVCGIHMGTLGFLNEISRKELSQTLCRLRNGTFLLEERVMIRAHMETPEGTIPLPDALNDIVIGRAELGKMARLNLYINDCFIQQYPADGLIISTPTGSTGYNLSSGGPIIHPKVSVFSVAPVCPHLLQNSPIVLPDTERICIDSAQDRNALQVCVDGVVGKVFTPKSRLVLGKSPYKARFIRLDEQYFYKTVFPKLLGVSHE